jgi:hypothetical protein
MVTCDPAFWRWEHHLNDREIRLSNGWTIKIGRGSVIYQRLHD